MRRNVLPVLHTRVPNVFTLIISLVNGINRIRTGNPIDDLHRLQRRILPYTNKQPVQEVYTFSDSGQNLSIQGTTLWPVHRPHEVHCDSQRGQMASNEKGYKDPPVPRRLVGQSYVPPGLSSRNTNPSIPLSRIGLASERGKIRAGAQANFQFCRLPVRLERAGSNPPQNVGRPYS